MELLNVTSRDMGEWRVLRLSGQLDVATAPQFRQELQEAQYGGAIHVVLDLEALEFLDSFGLGVIIGGVKRARLQGTRFAVAAAPDPIRRIFEMTGVDAALGLAASVDEAVRDQGSAPH